MSMNNIIRSAAFVFGSVAALAPGLQARTCSGNGDLIGGYGWVGSRSQEFVVTTAPPGSNGAVTDSSLTVAGSRTQIGNLTAGAQNSTAFASVGRVYLDGSGGMFSSSAPGAGVLQVGTYTVNLDCTVSATFTDTFAGPGAAGLTPVQASATFQGVVVQNGNEIDLAQSGASTGAVVTLRKAKQFNGCTNDGLNGTFGLAAEGVSTTSVVSATGGAPATTTAPFSLFGRIDADGAGNFVQDSAGLASPLSKLQFTGTYTVNPDCTGTAMLIGADAKSRKVDFVIVSPTNSGSSNGGQTLTLAFTDTGTVGSGVAQQQ